MGGVRRNSGRSFAAQLLVTAVAAAGFCVDTIAQTPKKVTAPPSLSGLAPVPGQRAPTASDSVDPASLRPLIAGLMIVSLDCALKLTPEDAAFLDKTPPGGVRIRPAGKPENLPLLVAMLRQAELRINRPILVGADPWELVGFLGDVSGKRSVSLPPLMAVAAAGGESFVEIWADVAARILRAAGLDWMPGPDLSLWPANPGSAASTRCIGSQPHAVAKLGTAVVRRLGERGITAAVWGFPGGSWTRDRNQPPVLTATPETWPAQDGIPYMEAAQVAAMVHVGDAEVPMWGGGAACVNPDVIQHLLRRQAAFRGIVVAGPVDSETLNRDAAEAARDALLAGADMILWQGGLRAVERAVDYLAAATARGDIPLALMREKAERAAATIQSFRNQVAGNAPPAGKPEESISALQRAGLTLIHLRGGALPLDRDAAPVGITGTVDLDTLQKYLKKSLKSVVQQPIMTAGHLGEVQTFEIDRLTRNMRGLNTVVVVATERERVETLIELIRALRQNAPRVVVVFLGRPDFAIRLNDADAILLAWGCAGSRETLMRAVADALTGRCALGMADLPDVLKLRAGESRQVDGMLLLRAPAGRLPCGLGDEYPPGFFQTMSPHHSLDGLVWNVDGKKVKGAVLTLSPTPGQVQSVSLTVRDVFKNTLNASFNVTCASPGP